MLGNIAIYFKHSVASEQLHPAVHNDFSTILADVAKLSGPIMFIPKLQAQFGKCDGKCGLQQSVAAASKCFVGSITVKSLGAGVPKLDWSVQPPRQDGFIR